MDSSSHGQHSSVLTWEPFFPAACIICQTPSKYSKGPTFKSLLHYATLIHPQSRAILFTRLLSSVHCLPCWPLVPFPLSFLTHCPTLLPTYLHLNHMASFYTLPGQSRGSIHIRRITVLPFFRPAPWTQTVYLLRPRSKHAQCRQTFQGMYLQSSNQPLLCEWEFFLKDYHLAKFG